MKGKFFLNYKVMAKQDAKDESTPDGSSSGGPSRPRTPEHHYLHDHRTKDALQEYRESLSE